MKERVYSKEQPGYFCPSCHRQVEIPFKGIPLKGNSIRIGCQCGKGSIVLKVEGDPLDKEELRPRMSYLRYCPRCRGELVHSYIKDTNFLMCEGCYTGTAPLDS